MEQDFTLISFLKTILKWKKQIAITTIVGTLLTAVFSWFFLDNYYKSYAVVYPLNMGLNDRSVLFNTGGATDFGYYGSKEDVNRLITLARSEGMRTHIINRFNLTKHYDIDTNKRFWRSKLNEEFENNFKVIKTEEGAIEISILDKDPYYALDIIKEFVYKLDEVNRSFLNTSRVKKITIFEKQIAEKEIALEKLNDTLAYYTKTYSITVRTLSDKTDIFDGTDKNAIEKFKILYASQKREIGNIIDEKTILSQMKVSLDANNKSIEVMELPYLADKKDKPKRSIIVLLAMAGLLFASIVGVLVATQVKEIKAKLDA